MKRKNVNNNNKVNNFFNYYIFKEGFFLFLGSLRNLFPSIKDDKTLIKIN